jgi:hypothetical protein
MGMKISAAIKKLIRKQLAASGGKARAKKYSHKQLSEWAKRGGRPRKTKETARGKTERKK